MALLPYVDEAHAPESTLKVLNSTSIKMNVLRMIGNSDAAFMPFNLLGGALLRKAKLNKKLRELAILRTAKLCKSNYEWTQHVPIAVGTGVTREQVEALDDWRPAACFDELERLTLQLTDEVTTGVKGKPETIEALKRHLGAAEIVELVMSIGFWGMVARVLETTEVELEPGAGSKNPFGR